MIKRNNKGQFIKGSKFLYGFKKGGISPRKGCHLSETTKEKLRNKNLGKKYSDFTKKKISNKKKGISTYWSVSGKNHWNWKGGIAKIDKSIRQMPEYLKWRSDVFVRDEWTCKTCQKNKCYITAHHKKSLHKIIIENGIKTVEQARGCKEIWDTDNGVALCEECHSLTDNYKGKGKKFDK